MAAKARSVQSWVRYIVSLLIKSAQCRQCAEDECCSLCSMREAGYPTRMTISFPRANKLVNMFQMPKKKGSWHLREHSILLESFVTKSAVEVRQKQYCRGNSQRQMHFTVHGHLLDNAFD